MPTKLPDHRIPMRWSDLDMLGHVNNVVYVAYAQQTRDALIASGDLLPPDVTAIAVDFKSPMHLARKDVVISTTADGPRLHMSIRREDLAEVAAEVELDSLPSPVPPSLGGWQTRFQLRATDTGVDADVEPRGLLEVLQEVRILYLHDLMPQREGHYVIARTEIRRHAPVPFSIGEVTTCSQVLRLGNRSVDIGAELLDSEGRVLVTSRTVMVGFDPDKQVSREFTAREREVFAERVVGG